MLTIARKLSLALPVPKWAILCRSGSVDGRGSVRRASCRLRFLSGLGMPRRGLESGQLQKCHVQKATRRTPLDERRNHGHNMTIGDRSQPSLGADGNGTLAGRVS